MWEPRTTKSKGPAAWAPADLLFQVTGERHPRIMRQLRGLMSSEDLRRFDDLFPVSSKDLEGPRDLYAERTGS